MATYTGPGILPMYPTQQIRRGPVIQGFSVIVPCPPPIVIVSPQEITNRGQIFPKVNN